MVHNMLSMAPVAPGGVVVGARMRTGWRRGRGGWASAAVWCLGFGCGVAAVPRQSGQKILE
jgi:hypothetical protein